MRGNKHSYFGYLRPEKIKALNSSPDSSSAWFVHLVTTRNEQGREEMPKTYKVSLEDLEFGKKLAAKFWAIYAKRLLEREDVESAAVCALCDSATRFDGREETNFRTFAYLRVRGALFDLLRKEQGIHQQPLSEHCLKPKRKNFTSENGLAVSRSLSEGDTDEYFFTEQISPEQEVGQRQLQAKLYQIINSLDSTQKEIVIGRYFKDESYTEIGERFGGRSKSWVSTHHVRALDSVKTKLMESLLNKRNVD